MQMALRFIFKFLITLPMLEEDFVGCLGYLTARLILNSSKSGPYTEGCDGKIMGGEIGFGSKLNIPSGAPSKTCPP